MSTPLFTALSHLTGRLADLRVPTPLRSPLYRAYGSLTGADLTESVGPLTIYPSLGAFFTRPLVAGARPIASEAAQIPSPVDGTFQAITPITDETILQAKNRPYPVRDLLAGVGADLELDGGHAWTIYLSPRDYHRIHCPESAALSEARWVPGARYSVAPKVLDRRQVLSINERVVLRLETERGPLLLVLVGALNVGRIRVVGVNPCAQVTLDPPPKFERGAELARFEMGSTIVLVSPAGGLEPLAGTRVGESVRMGQAIASWGE